MKQSKSILLLFLLFFAGGGAAWAHGARVGVYIGPYWGPSWYYPPPYYYRPEVIVVPAAPPPVYVERQASPADVSGETQPATQQSWYYCASGKGYYPYVKECPGGWQKVQPQPSSQP